MKFGLMVPTLNAGSEWFNWLDAFEVQTVKPDRLLVIDSKSIDNTAVLAKDRGFEAVVIERSEFDHGGTRQYGVDCLQDMDVCVFMTQDAILSNIDAFKKILEPFHDNRVAAVCGRQLPRKLATTIEAHARLYNYPSQSCLRTINDVGAFGLKTAFISNSFAAYRVSTLNEVGGFPKHVIFGEDMYVATKMLKAGYKIVYAAEACVYHSHNYSLWQEMKRYFDMGVFHAREPWIRQELGGAEGEGVKFVVSELKYVSNHEFWRVPEVLVRTMLRYSGFRLGLAEKKFPFWLKRKLAMNKRYFKR